MQNFVTGTNRCYLTAFRRAFEHRTVLVSRACHADAPWEQSHTGPLIFTSFANARGMLFSIIQIVKYLTLSFLHIILMETLT